MTESTPVHFRRIVVALDGSGHSEAALEAAARLAAVFDAELLGMYVEDAAALQVAEFDFTFEASRFSTSLSEISVSSLRREFRVQEQRARRAFEWAARHHRVRSRFDLVSGSVADELVRAADAADLITVGQSGSLSSSRHKIGTTARTVVARASGPVLVLRRGLRFDLPVVVLYDYDAEDSGAALDIGRALARQDRLTPLVVLVEAPSASEWATTERKVLERLGPEANQIETERVRCDSTDDVVSKAHRRRAGVLVVPAGSRGVQAERLADLVSASDMPVMLVRGPVRVP